MKQAESNAEQMLILSPLPGVAVIKTTWKSGGAPVEFIEGDEVRPGQPVVEVVNPAVMRVRARVNQADINELRVGQPVQVGLDAYPDLSFQRRHRPDFSDRPAVHALAEGAQRSSCWSASTARTRI